MAKSYFEILGVTSRSSPAEIRSAYRRLAKEFHPDHFKGGSGPFREIQEAYSILGNAPTRRAYERSLETPPIKRHARYTARPAPEPLVPERGPIDMGDISPAGSFQTFRPSFDEIFERLCDNFSSAGMPKSGRVETLTLVVPLTRVQALRGGYARVMVPIRSVCPTCRGTGGMGYYVCFQCAEAGAVGGEIPISISFPPGLKMDHATVVPLDRLGIRNLHLTVLFRLTDRD